MERGRSALAILVLIMLEFYSPTAIAGGVGVSGPADAQPTEPIGTVEFHPYKVPENVSAKARRDLEFLWSNTYVTRGYPLTALGPDGKNDLDRFGLTLAQDPLVNAFGFDMTHVQLVFDYLNFDGATYSTNTANPGFLVPITGASLDDRKHVDTYFYAPNVSAQDPGDAPGLNNRGAFPSDFISPREDISTGHQESLSDVVFGNATSFAGPRMDQVGDLSPLRWTRPMARTNWTWDHEFQHMFNSRLGGGVFTEIWSSIAEALGGEEADPPIHDVPYTWSVLTGCVGGASGCPRNNYAAWRSFAAYLTYNFRGTDPTFAGRSDDLVWRWARAGGGKRFPELANSLSPGACIECDQKSYFAGMDGHDRLMTLIQNWRIANYVNNPNLYEGQYGFPSQFGFDPVRDVGNWGDIDGDLSDNDVAIPPDVPAMASWRTKEAVFFKRPAGSGFGECPLSLEMFGSEYFIVHADASAIGPSQDLVIRCGSDSSVVERTTDAGCNLYVKDSRLSVSVVAYSAHSAVAGQELFRNPAWARWVVTKSVDVDSVATDLDFVIPGFGDSIQAIVVVASMVDGPSRQYVSESAILGAPRLPLRLEFGLRNHAVQSPNPVLVAGSAYPEAAPTWSPDGAFLAYEGAPSAGAPHQIYKVGLAGGQPTLIHPNPARFQESPDWSPRGDWIAFVQDQLSGARNVWLHIVGGGSGTTQLTYWNGVVGLPVIQPNGQGLVYVMSASPGNSPWQLRRVDVDGANDVLIKTLTYPDGTSMPKPGALRWAPDGSKIFLTVNDTIQSLPSGGGSLGVASTQRAWDFDLPLGQGLVAISEARRIEAAQWCWAHFSLECCSPFGYSAQVAELSRAALLDTAASQVRPRFFRTGASFGDVRWSWDNTRLAYSSNVSGPTNFDLFWGEATLNRAPHFAGLIDQSFPACQLFNLYVSATDPDGEPVTFKAAYLPPGAQFVPPNRFKWTYPQPGTYYTVFRALDPSGGVDNRVVRLDVYYDPGICEGGGLLMAGGDESVMDVSLIESNGERTAGGETRRLRRSPIASGSNPTVRVASWASAALVYAPQLAAIDHSGEVEIRSMAGELVTGRRQSAIAVQPSDLHSAADINEGTGEGVEFGGERALTIELAPVEGDASTAPYLVIETLDLRDGLTGSAPIQIAVPEETGSWRVVEEISGGAGVREYVTHQIASSRVRLTSASHHVLQNMGWFHVAQEDPTPMPVELASAVVTGPLRGDGESVLANSQPWLIAAGEVLALTYSGPVRVEDRARDWMITMVAQAASTPLVELSSMRPQIPSLPVLPLEFKLKQSQPNPSAWSTTIRFDLPAGVPVGLEVFDLFGRKVRTLAHGEWPAGYHAVEWNNRDELGHPVKPGIYLYRLRAGAFVAQRKLVVKP